MEMERRDVLKAVGAVAGTIAAAASGAGLGASPASAADCEAPGGNAVVGIKSPDPGAFIAGRFAGKTFIVTGSARGMGAAAATRLAREGANVVGVDWLNDQGELSAPRYESQAVRASSSTATSATPRPARRRWPRHPRTSAASTARSTMPG